MSYPLKAQMRWPALAQDLALISIPNSPIEGVDEICLTYGITRAELKDILRVPYFQSLVDASLQELKKQGSQAGLRYRAMQLSQSLAEKLYRKANADGMGDKEAVKLLEILLKASGVDKEPSAQVNTQVNIALPFPAGVDKVARYLPAVEQ